MKEQIVKAEKQHIDELIFFAGQLWGNHNTKNLKKEFETKLSNKESVIFLYVCDDKIVAFSMCGLRHDYVEGCISSPVAYLEGIFVLPEYRRKGIGKQLVEACQKWGKQQGCEEFASDCEFTNKISQQFHNGCNFKESNRIVCFVKDLKGKNE